MGREQKKGKAGNARAYITRAKALKKLQLSLPEFRRLCILKGIFPRDPKKKVEGADKTYYLRKDIDFLAHERTIDTIRAQHVHRKKVVKAKAKKQLDVLKALALKTPRANLDHIIVERYPVFADALRELDDPLCVVALFATLPADSKFGISPARVATCKRLMTEFLHFVARTHALRRVFVSIKGFYYQAEIDGEILTWITPHRFSQVLPSDVDYSVMMTFLELYECLLHFVNFRLYTSHNLAYPPKMNQFADSLGHEIDAIVAEPKLHSESKAPASVPRNRVLSSDVIEAAKQAAMQETSAVDAEESDDDFSGDDRHSIRVDDTVDGGHVELDDRSVKSAGDAVLPHEDEENLLFADKIIVVGRETPATELVFVLRAAGAKKVIRQDELGDACDDLLTDVTHWVVDRPAVPGKRIMSIEYVQPQFVFDSVNAGVLLPPALYAPGAKLPPHLSPFVGDEVDGGYRPWFKDIIDRIKAGDPTVMADSAIAAYLQAKPKVRARKEKLLSVQKDRDIGDDAVAQLSTVTNTGVRTGEEPVVEKNEKPRPDVVADEEEEDDDDEGNGGQDDGDPDIIDRSEKELKLMMMSRKKMKRYSKFAKTEKRNADRKRSLTTKRDLLTPNVNPGDSEKCSNQKRRKLE